MDKYDSGAGRSERPSPADAASVAESVQADFAALVGILENRLAALADSDSQVRRHVSDAKAAAERGVELSGRLLAALRIAEEPDSTPARE